MQEKKYQHKSIEAKWKNWWHENHINSANLQSQKTKYYIMEMFPYTSARIHMGHVRNYSIGDVIARKKMMEGLNVLHPIGFDAFGLPAENAAIKHGIHPAEWTYENIKNIQSQLAMLGISYDWDRKVATCDPEYYRWTQWLFLKFYERGLVYRKKDVINWCDSCKTVLANEQVEEGKCWRCSTVVKEKSMDSWFFRITKYADKLLEGHEIISNGWPSKIIEMQKNWIGRSYGVEIKFKVESSKLKTKELSVFTTRPDTLFGVTYIVLSPKHPFVSEIITSYDPDKKIRDFVEKSKLQMNASPDIELEKEGVFTGFYALNPANSQKVQIWIGNYVLMEYGTGAIMAVPTHDQRDFEFAKKYKLDLKIVINPKDVEIKESTMEHAFEEEGIMVNSDKFNGINSCEAKDRIAEWLEKEGCGKKTVKYRLRDWSISRQRYWGEPIPIIYCEKCGMVPVPDKDLPVLLPKEADFKSGGPPLATSKEFLNTKCPKCGGQAKRETDTMDCFVASSWYFLRYLSPKCTESPFKKEDAAYWMPVDQYIGGPEHATKHLIYARFFTMVLKDMGLLEKSEPFQNLLCQGMVIKDGSKMSKSKGNIVDPVKIIEDYGADVIRLFILFAAPPDTDLEWNDDGIEGANRFLNRVWRMVDNHRSQMLDAGCQSNKEDEMQLKRKLHQTIKKITEDLDRFHFNTAISGIMELVNFISQKLPSISKELTGESLKIVVLLLAPFTPHICEELWQLMGNKNSIFNSFWPSYDPQLIKEENATIVVQVNGKVRDRLVVPVGTSLEYAKEKIMKNEKILKWTENKNIENIVWIQDKLINIVVS